MEPGRVEAGHPHGDGLAKGLSVGLIAIVAVAAIAMVPPAPPAAGPAAMRDLMGLVGQSSGSAGAFLAKRRLLRTHNGDMQFYYASEDGCHGHAGLRLFVVAGLVVGWQRTGIGPARPGCEG
jgi:hypothetical protein